VYFHLVGADGTPAPLELVRWRIAERFGWTLPEVDSMSLADLHEMMQIDDGVSKARAFRGGR
jgi:hypothetical protein